MAGILTKNIKLSYGAKGTSEFKELLNLQEIPEIGNGAPEKIEVTVLTDNVKMISSYPEKGMLVSIVDETLAVGGCVPNTGIDLAKLDPSIKVYAYGRVGNDYKGEYVLNQMKNFGLNVDGVKVSKTAPTSYSDVMTVVGTGERTFFHNRGANAEFCIDDVDVDKLDCDIFHIGYLMLLDSFDKLDKDGSTPMAKILKFRLEFSTKIVIFSINLLKSKSKFS